MVRCAHCHRVIKGEIKMFQGRPYGPICYDKAVLYFRKNKEIEDARNSGTIKRKHT